MFGTYTVDHGTYGITIQNIIKKNFTFNRGGTIVFGGDPYQAALNLQAVYTVSGVSLSDLNIGNSFSSNTIRVNCLMNIGGQPAAPQVDFDLEMPTVNADEQQMVRSVINGQQEMNQQVVYLLAIGRFYNQGANNSTSATGERTDQTSLAMQSFLSGTLSSQINTLINQFIKNDNWNFGANISTGNEGWHNAEYEGIINGRMLNNRLLINGQFGYRDNATQANPSFIGDFDVQYLLYPNGNLALKVYNQDFVISNRKLALAQLTFSTPAGKIYNYDNRQALAYNETSVDANFKDMVDYSKLVNSDESAQQTVITRQEIAVGVPDVDINIPEYKRVNDNTFAVIIANEKYTLAPQVPMAGNDGRIFAQYCEKTLGLPKENILQYPDATYGKMIRALQDIKNIANAYNKIRVIFYYAGHGVPNEATRDAFLLPIDADGSHTEVCYPLKKLYNELAALNAFSVVVFLDACFSGMTGDGSTLSASSRGVALKARQAEPQGNVVVLSAASGDETAYPYNDHGHGLFTYFLLKKLQASKGSVNLGELSNYIIENVKQKSVLINHKIQTPTVSYPVGLQSSWQKLKLR